MKTVSHTFLLYFLFVGLRTFSQTGGASVSAIKQQDSIVELAISFHENFNPGANPFALYIGDKFFLRSKEGRNGNFMRLFFYIPLSDFELLPDNQQAVLVYGNYSENEKKTRGEKDFLGKHWMVGAVKKEMLIK